MNATNETREPYQTESFAANLYDHGTRAELPKSKDKTKVYL